MEYLTLIAVGIAILGFGSISGRIQRTMVTPPMIFVVFGVSLGPLVFGGASALTRIARFSTSLVKRTIWITCMLPMRASFHPAAQ